MAAGSLSLKQNNGPQQMSLYYVQSGLGEALELFYGKIFQDPRKYEKVCHLLEIIGNVNEKEQNTVKKRKGRGENTAQNLFLAQ